MNAVFKVPVGKDYVVEHDRFVASVMVQMSIREISDIIYDGAIPPSAEPVKFSEYLSIMGCVPVPDGFSGYFGTKSYRAVLQQFVCESSSTHAGRIYYLDIDVKPYVQSRGSANADLSLCLEAVINRHKKLRETE